MEDPESFLISSLLSPVSELVSLVCRFLLDGLVDAVKNTHSLLAAIEKDCVMSAT